MNSAGSGRQIEVSILEMAAGKLRGTFGEDEAIDYNSGIDDALRFNQKVWDVFCADWSSDNCPLDDSLRQNLLSLGVFVKKRTFTMLAQPTRSGVQALVDLNDNLVQGLKSRAEAAEGDEAGE